MRLPPRFEIDGLFEGSLRRLRVEAEYFSRQTKHGAELGQLNEMHLVKLLRSYLPPKFGIGTGFIACGGDASRLSPQCDIIFFDALNNAPIYASDTWSIFPIEMVYGVMEIKTTLKPATLKDSFVKCAAIRDMAQPKDGTSNKAYLIQDPPQKGKRVSYRTCYVSLPPRFFVFAYDGWKALVALKKNFVALTGKYERAHIHGICNLHVNGGLFVKHMAFEKGKSTHFYTVERNGFHRLLMDLPKTMTSMLPQHRGGLGFDQVDLAHYRLATP